jgi:tetratricopeptide (TPR) repeat protein
MSFIIRVHLNKALSLFYLGRYQETLKACEDSAKVNLAEFGAAGFMIYGNAYLGLDKLEEAMEAFSEGNLFTSAKFKILKQVSNLNPKISRCSIIVVRFKKNSKNTKLAFRISTRFWKSIPKVWKVV